jgi:hypothetical protein
VLSAGAGTAKATFIYGSYIGSLIGKAVYPYDSHAITDTQLTINIPASYELGANTNHKCFDVRCVKFQDRFNEDFESDFGWE